MLATVGGMGRCYGGSMASPILLCADGSDDSLGALAAGLDLLDGRDELIVVTVSNAPGAEALVGTGHAGAELSLEEYDEKVARADEIANAVVGVARRELGITDAEVRLLQGDPGPAICQLATELSAKAIVIGSRGRGGLKRVLLGSVSDYVTRHAPCSVIVTRVAPGS